MNKCEYCDKSISEEDRIVQCPDCMNNIHLKCMKERIVETETVTGRRRRYKTYYYKCPICSKKIQNNNDKFLY
jgi:hypothetical protein